MSRQIAAAVCMTVVGFGAPSPVAVAQFRVPTTPNVGSVTLATDPQVLLSIKDLMESFVDPSADTLWGAVGSVVDNEGIHEMFPKTQEEWQEPRRAAVRIIEGSNLLMIPGREAAPPGTKSDAPGAELEPPQITDLIREQPQTFEAFAKALQAVGLEAVRAIDANDTSLLLEVGAQMESVCEGCHQTFWYPPRKDISINRQNIQPSQSR